MGCLDRVIMTSLPIHIFPRSEDNSPLLITGNGANTFFLRHTIKSSIYVDLYRFGFRSRPPWRHLSALNFVCHHERISHHILPFQAELLLLPDGAQLAPVLLQKFH